MITTKTIAAGLVALTTLSAVPANAASFNFQFGPGPSYHDRHGGYDNHGAAATTTGARPRFDR